MVIGAHHWVSALSVAAVAHVAALLWLSQPTARVDPPRVTTGIVIALENKASQLRETTSPLKPPPDPANDLKERIAVSERRPDPVARQPASTTADKSPIKQSRADPPQPVERLSPDLVSEPEVEAMPNVAPIGQEREITATTTPSAMPLPSPVEPEPRPATIASETPVVHGDSVDRAPISGVSVPPKAVSDATIQTLSGIDTPDVTSALGTATVASSWEQNPTVQRQVPSHDVTPDIAEPAATVAVIQLEAIHASDAIEGDPIPVDKLPPLQQSTGKKVDDIEHVFDKNTDVVPPGAPAEAAPLAPYEGVTAHTAPLSVLSEQQRPVLGVTAHYAGLLKGWLQRHMRYPHDAWLAGLQGTSVLRFSIDRNGKVIASTLERSSGHRVLDREAMQMVQRADPFPAIPYEIAGQELELRVPIVFFIKDFERQREIPPIYLK